MGYRLEVYKAEYVECFGKLYGYIDRKDLKELKSYKWLLRNEYITGEPDEYWNYGFNPNIVLDHWDFEEFLKLYIEDFNNVRGEEVLKLEDYKELLNDKSDKILMWE